VWVGTTRAHFEIRELDANEIMIFRDVISRQLAKVSGVLWVEVNPYTRRVVVAFQEGTVTSTLLERAIASAEHEACCAAVPFGTTPVPHPADSETLTRQAFELGADITALVVGVGLSLLPITPSRAGAAVASTLAIVKSSERWRRKLDNALGSERTNLILSLAISSGNGLAQRPVACATDAFHKFSLLRESMAQHEVWLRREPLLCSKPTNFGSTLTDLERRAFPLPNGPIEDYANRAWMVSLTGFLFSFLTTRNLRRAGAAVYGGIPKPAQFGRDVFSAELGRSLANRNILVMDPRALRRLDRANCLVLAEDVVTQSHFTLHEFACIENYDTGATRSRYGVTESGHYNHSVSRGHVMTYSNHEPMNSSKQET
jgi:hypothetical protein